MRAVVIKDMFCRGSILCCALLLCCLCLWPAGARALSSDAARACVVEAGGAVDNADAACFEQLVDMDAILNEAVDLFMKEAAKPENSSLLPPMLALMFSGAAMAEDNGLGVRKLLVSEARAFVHNGIASGAFAGKSVQDYRTEGWVAPLFESVSMGRKEIRNVGTPVRQGKDWIVPFVLRDHGNGNSYAVRARVSDAGGSPRVVAVENLRQLFVILGKEAQAWKARRFGRRRSRSVRHLRPREASGTEPALRRRASPCSIPDGPPGTGLPPFFKGKIENHPFYRVVFCVLAGKRTGKPPFRQAGGAAGDQCFRCSLRSQRARRRRSRTMKPPLHSTMKAAAMKTPR